MDHYAFLFRALNYVVLSNLVAAVAILFSLGIFCGLKKTIVDVVEDKDNDFSFNFLVGLSVAICLIAAIGFLVGFASPAWWIILAVFTLLGAASVFPKPKELLGLILIFNVSGLFIPIGVVLYGGINIFHDGFTYISLAQWNADHPFLKPVVVDNPMLTQVAMYQLLDFRMGAVNFFAALLAISGEKWSVAVYPIWAQFGVFGAAVGLYSAANVLAGKPKLRFSWLVAISMTMGPGIFYFSAQAGFIPQLYGFIGIIGLSVTLVCADKGSFYAGNTRAIVRSSIYVGVFMSMVVVCYSEIAPMAIIMAGVYLLYMLGLGLANRKIEVSKLVLLIFVVSATVVLLGNYQIYRAYMALKLQSGAVVGWDVWWSAGPLMAFATGVKEGVGAGGTRELTTGEMWGMVLLLGLVVVFGLQRLRRGDREPILFAVAAFCAIAVLALFVMLKAPNVVDGARFQQWSFFKLSGWLAAPLACLIVAASSAILVSTGPLRWVILIPFGLGVYFDYANSRNQANFYEQIGQKSLDQWADDVVKQVAGLSDTPNKCVTINFPQGYGKLRQFASYALYPREIYGDWGDDGYVVHFLDDKYERDREDCVFLSAKDTEHGTQVDAFRQRQEIPGDILYAGGNYNIERSATDTWNWVEDTVRYELRNTGKNNLEVRLSFKYLGLPGNYLTVSVGEGSSPHRFQVTEKLQGAEITVKLQSGVSIVPINFTFEGKIQTLSANDARLVRGRLLNVRID